MEANCGDYKKERQKLKKNLNNFLITRFVERAYFSKYFTPEKEHIDLA